MKIDENEYHILVLLWHSFEEKQVGLEIDGLKLGDMKNLMHKGWVDTHGQFLKLTTEGEKEASKAVRQHRLAERLLADVLSTEDRLVHEQACRMEHILFNGLANSICTLLGHPQFCPHGKPIPRGECCRQMRESVERFIAPLNEMKPGQKGAISYIHLNNAGKLQKLMAMGVLPGTPLKLIRRYPSVVFEAGNSQFAVDEEIASDIHVRLRQE